VNWKLHGWSQSVSQSVGHQSSDRLIAPTTATVRTAKTSDGRGQVDVD